MNIENTLNQGISILKENKIDNGVSCLINGDSSVGKWMSEDKRINLISATGSTRMGKDVAQKVGARLGKSLLELGGNNAMIISNHEIVSWYQTRGLNGHGMNHGGKFNFDFGTVKFVSAIHSSVLPDGCYGGNPGGFVIYGNKVKNV